MAADIGALTTWSTTASSNQPDASDSISNLDDNLQQIQAEVRKYLGTKGADIASAATVDLATATGNYVHITGVMTITALGTVVAGIRMLLVFDDALTFTHNATSLILPSAANIATIAGDRCEVVSLGSGNWRCLWYQRANGEAISAGTYQPLDALLTALAAQTTAANNIQAYSGADTPTLLTTGTASGNVPLVGTASDTEAVAGLSRRNTTAEATTGTLDAGHMTPLKTAQAIAALAGAATYQVFTTTGANTWTKPATGTMAFIQVWGGGGGGGRGSPDGGGGGGGQYREWLAPLSALGTTETVTVGAGGAGRTATSGTGVAGGNSSFGTHVTATGGGGGGNGFGGNGGGYVSYLIETIDGGTLYFGGGNNFSAIEGGGGGGGVSTSGGGAIGGSAQHGGGGGGAGEGTATGNPGGTSVFGGNGGLGGDGSPLPTSGTTPGGGGGGGYTTDAGSGARGEVRVTVF